MGAVVGALVAPVFVFAYVAMVRTFVALSMLIREPHIWYGNMDLVGVALNEAHVRWYAVVSGIMEAMGLSLAVALVSALLFTFGCVASYRTRRRWPFYMTLSGLFLLMFAPLLHDVRSLLGLIVASGLIWVLPGAMLSAMTPFLRRSYDSASKWWGWFSVASAIVLLMTMKSVNFEWWLLGLVAVSLIAGLLFLWGAKIEHIWPLAAFSMATAFCAATMLFQATFAGTLRDVRTLTSRPTYLPHARRNQEERKNPRLLAYQRNVDLHGSPAGPAPVLPADATVLEYIVHFFPAFSAKVTGRPTAPSAIMTMSLRLELLVVSGRDQMVARRSFEWARQELLAIKTLEERMTAIRAGSEYNKRDASNDEQQRGVIVPANLDMDQLTAEIKQHRTSAESQRAC